MTDATTAKLSEIVRRLEEAKGPDDELDARIWCAIQGVEFVKFERLGSSERNTYTPGPLRFPEWSSGFTPYTLDDDA